MTRLVNAVLVTTVLTGACLAGCDDNFDTTRVGDPYTSFGGIIYREGCQRVAYTGELAQKAAGERQTVDVSGALGKSVCVDNMPPPADAPLKLKAMPGQKDSLIATVDAILPKPFLSDLENFLEQLLPLHDDGTMQTAIKSLGDLLGTMHDDPDFSPALAHLAARNGYRPTKTAAGLVHTVIEYPNIDDFLGKLLGLIAPGGTAETEWKQVLTALSKALHTVQPVPNPGDPERTLRLALNVVLATHPDLASGTARPLVQRDFRGVAMATMAGGTVTPPFVDLDGDGLADVDAMGHYVDATGAPLDLPTPFPETGKADTAPRDSLGRALIAQGSTTTLYQYLDLDGTVIGGMTREALTLMDPKKDTTLGLVWGASALLGPRATQTKVYTDAGGGMIDSITYNGYDVTQSAVLDLLHSFVQLLGDPNIDLTLQTTQTLMAQYESPTTRAVGAMLDSADRGKKHPEAQVPATSTIYDDLMPLLVRILKVPGLAEDLLTAMEDPHVKGFAPMIARLMTSKNQIDFNHAGGPDFNLVNNLDSPEPIDRTSPDTDYNQSLMQRIAHLIHDANGAQFCNKQDASFSLIINFGPYDKCKLFEVDDLALIYVLSMASPSIIQATKGTSREATTYAKASFREAITDPTVHGLIFDNGVGDTLLQGQVGITGFTRFPTPKALARSLFLRPNEQSSFMQGTTDPIPCTDGDKFTDAHDKSLFAWETAMVNNPAGFPNDTFYDAVRPLVDAFAKHDECLQIDDKTGNCLKEQNAAKIFVDLLAMLHEHWHSPASSNFGNGYQSTSRAQPRFAYADNVVSYEPLLAEVLGQSDLMPAILGLAPTLNTMTVDGTPTGQPARPVLIATARYLLDPGAAPPGLAYRNGMTSTTYSDGVTPVPQVTPYYLIADAYAHKRAVLGALTSGAQADAWRTSTSALVDQMLTVEKVGNNYQFKNRRVHAVTLVLLDFVRGRLASHTQAGDVDQWVHTGLTQDLTDVLGSPTFAAMGDFVTKVEADPDARDQLYQLLQYLVDEADNDLVFQTALTTLADQVQTFLDDPDLVPVARVLGSAMDPVTGPTNAQLTLVKKARDVDTKKALLTILRNLYRQNSDGVYPASDLADILSELNRVQPGKGGALDAADYKTMLGEIQNFLLDDQRGFTRFLNIVRARGPH
jgi:hypothetical protein